MAKIKLPKKPHSMVINLIKARRSYRDLSSQADPERVNQNACVVLVENTVTHA